MSRRDDEAWDTASALLVGAGGQLGRAQVPRLLTVLARPFEERAEFADYAEPAPANQCVYKTFCGT